MNFNRLSGGVVLLYGFNVRGLKNYRGMLVDWRISAVLEFQVRSLIFHSFLLD